MTNIVAFSLISTVGLFFCRNWDYSNYLMWMVAGLVLTILASIITLFVYRIVYKNDISFMLNKVLKREK